MRQGQQRSRCDRAGGTPPPSSLAASPLVSENSPVKTPCLPRFFSHLYSQCLLSFCIMSPHPPPCLPLPLPPVPPSLPHSRPPSFPSSCPSVSLIILHCFTCTVVRHRQSELCTHTHMRAQTCTNTHTQIDTHARTSHTHRETHAHNFR